LGSNGIASQAKKPDHDRHSPGLGTSASMSMSFAVLVKRTPATAMVMTPMTMKASPAQLAKRSPCAAS